MHSMEKLRPLALLLLRVALGAIFIYHGYPKLFAHSHDILFDMGNRGGLPAYVARLAGALEVFGGSMLIIGVFTRFVASILAIELAVVLWMSRQLFEHPAGVGRYEFPLACAVAMFALATFGAGSVSLDATLSGGGGKLRKAKG